VLGVGRSGCQETCPGAHHTDRFSREELGMSATTSEPRLLVGSGVSSRVGKMTATIGLLEAFHVPSSAAMSRALQPRIPCGYAGGLGRSNRGLARRPPQCARF
jgi:hypothetical protein